jgi:ABC-type multidrug transport system ATPase subunit
VQRLAWARALLHNPCLLLLDEPETGLDHDGNVLIDALFTEHTRRGGSILFTTHHLERALEMSEQIVLLNGGRVAFQQESASLTLDELRRAYREVVK